ncbi:hypothetical protein Pmar_PMAR020754 [Perkinsus marinus ATCC 50983]|uniref:Uncharacterized protein n=1 Tax=Perkinsus marinus (strain ATCC 50983 / TXsc) TaxID=423536 RepID=C5KQR8_PERM5|nr:hypothetical protein Pmar_PMAR020754 [Perkinsus marinus ATCC 50983]EER13164.1 hypothetical protein Pmar_PMAR020754 [Perkinsus marinus ATCC 50983]|eukprot:XP_002781369.1 hypothetical protein Pmar_PMAR020754 [Perkinsus marinus ATCC 50983]
MATSSLESLLGASPIDVRRFLESQGATDIEEKEYSDSRLVRRKTGLRAIKTPVVND